MKKLRLLFIIASLISGLLTSVAYAGDIVPKGGSGTNTDKWATSSVDTTAIYPNTAKKIGIGTSTPSATLSVSAFNSSAPLVLVASSSGSSATSTPFIITPDEHIGFGTYPYAKVQYLLTADPDPSFVTDWDSRHVVWGLAGSRGKALGVSVDDNSDNVILSFLQPDITFLNSTFNLNTFSVYSGGTTLGVYQDTQGKVGLGTSAPANELDVFGSAVIGSTFAGQNAAPDGLSVVGPTGIGTLTPAGNLQLDVVGNGQEQAMTRFTDLFSGNSLSIGNSGGTNDSDINIWSSTGAINFGDGSSGATTRWWNGGSGVGSVVSAGGDSYFQVDGNGYFGINTNSPTALFDVNDRNLADANPSFQIDDNDCGCKALQVFSSAARVLNVGAYGNGNEIQFSYSNDSSYFNPLLNGGYSMSIGTSSYNGLRTLTVVASSTSGIEQDPLTVLINNDNTHTTPFIIKNSGNVGIGTSSPFASTTIQSNSSTGDAFAIATSSGNAIGGYDNDGHRWTSGPKPAISSCGTGSGSVVGDDQSGDVTTATAATSCTVTFAKAYQKAPICTATDNSLVGFADVSSVTTSAVIFGISSALTGGHIYYQCAYHR